MGSYFLSIKGNIRYLYNRQYLIGPVNSVWNIVSWLSYPTWRCCGFIAKWTLIVDNYGKTVFKSLSLEARHIASRRFRLIVPCIDHNLSWDVNEIEQKNQHPILCFRRNKAKDKHFPNRNYELELKWKQRSHIHWIHS